MAPSPLALWPICNGPLAAELLQYAFDHLPQKHVVLVGANVFVMSSHDAGHNGSVVGMR